MKEIDDNEIRFIGSAPTPRRPWWWLVVVAVVAVALLFLLLRPRGNKSQQQEDQSAPSLVEVSEVVGELGYTMTYDTIVNDIPLRILTPCNATPRLAVGREAMDNTNAVLIVQAADIRADNGMVVGQYVVEGEVLSRGQAKPGICSIVDGQMTLATASSDEIQSQLFAQAIEQRGYFFRQYVLVREGQMVDNKPKGKALRRALCQKDGVVVVVLSKERESLHDFAQALVDIGVEQAISLVGGDALGKATDRDGQPVIWGDPLYDESEMENFIVWE